MGWIRGESVEAKIVSPGGVQEHVSGRLESTCTYLSGRFFESLT